MKVMAICFTQNGAGLISRMRDISAGTDMEIEGYHKCKGIGSSADIPGLNELKGDTSDLVKTCFERHIPLIFVSACGIAVRLIAPFIKDKLDDIPVLVIDEAGRFVIPILSGHVGGANTLALKVAGLIGATCVTTTATDIDQTFSCDSFAVDNRLTITDKDAIKTVSSKVLRGEPISISIKDYPPAEDVDMVISDEQIQGDHLWLSPKRYVLGIGCKKDKSVEDIEALTEEILAEAGIGYQDIYAFGSIDLKAKEEGLLTLSARHRIPFVTFTPDMLRKAPGEFEGSRFVEEVTGVDNVCERAAVLLAGRGGRLMIGKRTGNGVTVALAVRAAL